MTSVDAVLNQLIDLNEIDWKELVPGVTGKRVWADPATKRTAMFIRFSPGASLPRHAHEGDELVYVLEGCVADEYAAVTAGNVGYRPDGCTHTVRSPTGATAFAVVTGGAVPRRRGRHRRPALPGVRPGDHGVAGCRPRSALEALLGRSGGGAHGHGHALGAGRRGAGAPSRR